MITDRSNFYRTSEHERFITVSVNVRQLLANQIQNSNNRPEDLAFDLDEDSKFKIFD